MVRHVRNEIKVNGGGEEREGRHATHRAFHKVQRYK